ncbi:MAG: Rid family detoxifying hydrolase [Lentisphaeria bacterium]
MTGSDKAMTAVTSAELPAAAGPYSQAVRAGGLLFTSGLLPLRAGSDELVGGADTVAQAGQVLANLERLLAAAGTSMARVVKVTVYLVDLKDFQAVNALYATHFTAPFPARSCVQVAALPKNARIELDAVAVLE